MAKARGEWDMCVEQKKGKRKRGYRRGGARGGDGHAISAAWLLVTALRYVVVWSLILAMIDLDFVVNFGPLFFLFLFNSFGRAEKGKGSGDLKGFGLGTERTRLRWEWADEILVSGHAMSGHDIAVPFVKRRFCPPLKSTLCWTAPGFT